MATKIVHQSAKDPVCNQPNCPFLRESALALLHKASPQAVREATSVIERDSPFRRVVPLSRRPEPISPEARREEDRTISRYEHFLVRRGMEMVSRTDPASLKPFDLLLCLIVENAGAQFQGVQHGVTEADCLVLFCATTGPARRSTLALPLYEVSTTAIKTKIDAAQAQNWGKVPA